MKIGHLSSSELWVVRGVVGLSPRPNIMSCVVCICIPMQVFGRTNRIRLNEFAHTPIGGAEEDK